VSLSFSRRSSKVALFFKHARAFIAATSYFTKAGKNILGIINYAASKISDKMVDQAKEEKLIDKNPAKSRQAVLDFFKKDEQKYKDAEKKRQKKQ
jgi:hypothetical protein